MSTNATIQCECCSSQLAKPLRLGKTRRDICDDCLGFMARWWIELGIWEMPEQESPTANANPATPSPAPCAVPPSECPPPDSSSIPGLARAIEAHHQWVRDRFPESRFWFPGADGVFPLGRVALTMALNRVCAKLGLPKRTAHGLRAFYVTVHRSRGEGDAQVAARIGDATAGLISSTYGNLPEVWSGGEPLDWMPRDGVPAWANPGDSGEILQFPGSVERSGTGTV